MTSLNRIFPYAVITVIGVVSILLTFRDYGMTWDEHVQLTYGELVLDYFRSGFQDNRCNEYLNLRFYGPLFDLIAAVIYQLEPVWKLEIRHFLNALLGLLALLGVYRFGKLLPGQSVAFFACLTLAMLPRFYGHAFNNPKDIPFACAFTWAMVAVVETWLAEERSWKHLFFCGISIGSVLAIRSGGIALLLAFGLALLCLRKVMIGKTSLSLRNLRQIIGVCGLAWLVMVAFWPWAHAHPIVHPWEAAAEAVSFSQRYTVFFQGNQFFSDALPRSYLPLYIAITTPPIIFCLGLFGVIVTGRSLIGKLDETQTVPGFLFMWLFVPLAMCVVMRPNVYDGMRQFLFLLPAFALFAGIGASAIAERIPRRLGGGQCSGVSSFSPEFRLWSNCIPISLPILIGLPGGWNRLRKITRSTTGHPVIARPRFGAMRRPRAQRFSLRPMDFPLPVWSITSIRSLGLARCSKTEWAVVFRCPTTTMSRPPDTSLIGISPILRLSIPWSGRGRSWP